MNPSNKITVNPASVITIGLKWDEVQGQEIDLDLQCVVMNELGQIEEAVYYNELASKISKIKLSEDSKGEKAGFDEMLTLDLTTCPFQVKYLAILICSFKGTPLSYVESSQLQVVQNNVVIYESSIGAHGANSLSVLPCIFERSYEGTWGIFGVEEAGTGKTFLESEDLIKKGLLKTGFDHVLFQECKNWNGGKSFNLQKNQSLVLPESMTEVCVGLGWDSRCDIDSSVLLFGDKGDNIDTVYFLNKQTSDQSVIHSGDDTTGDGAGDDEVISIFLHKVSPAVQVLWAAITVYSSNQQFDDVEGAYCRLFDKKTKKEFCKFNLSKNKDGVSNGNIMCSITRCQQGTWSVSPKGFYSKNTKTANEIAPIIQEIMQGNFSHVKTLEQIYPNQQQQQQQQPVVQQQVIQPPVVQQQVQQQVTQATFELTIEKATGLAAFDSNGFSDPYISFKLNGKRLLRTKVINKSLNPVWNQLITITLKLGDELTFKFLDHDNLAADDFMGSCYLKIDQNILDKQTFSTQLKVQDNDQKDSPKFTGNLFVSLKKTQ